MKVQLQNTVYRRVTSKCFICNKSRFGKMQNMLLLCRDYENKCPISNLYNDKIFIL